MISVKDTFTKQNKKKREIHGIKEVPSAGEENPQRKKGFNTSWGGDPKFIAALRPHQERKKENWCVVLVSRLTTLSAGLQNHSGLSVPPLQGLTGVFRRSPMTGCIPSLTESDGSSSSRPSETKLREKKQSKLKNMLFFFSWLFLSIVPVM